MHEGKNVSSGSMGYAGTLESGGSMGSGGSGGSVGDTMSSGTDGHAGYRTFPGSDEAGVRVDERYSSTERYFSHMSAYFLVRGDRILLSHEIREHEDWSSLRYWIETSGLVSVMLDRETFLKEKQIRTEDPGIPQNLVDEFTRQLFRDACERHATDIHITNSQEGTVIRMRIHGDMCEYRPARYAYSGMWRSEAFGDQFMHALFNCHSHETGRPLFSRTARLDGRIIDPAVLPAGVPTVRMHTEPIQTLSHEPGVFMSLRLLYDGSGASGTLEERLTTLGYLASQIRDIRDMTRCSGLCLVSGATGQGKSTLLKHVFEGARQAYPEASFMSIEDPVEFHLQGVEQILVAGSDTDESGRLTGYTEAIRGAMRSDPDFILVGEIRDPGCAGMCTSLALSGHRVWSTIHAGDAFGSVLRMEQLLRGEKGTTLETLCDSTGLNGLIHQRLLPLLCPYCRIPLDRTGHDLTARSGEGLSGRLERVLGTRSGTVFLRGEGCSHCRQGVIGQSVAAEVLRVTPGLRELLRKGRIEEARQLWRETGGHTCRDVAIQKMLQGEIDPGDCERFLQQPLVDSVSAR